MQHIHLLLSLLHYTLSIFTFACNIIVDWYFCIFPFYNQWSLTWSCAAMASCYLLRILWMFQVSGIFVWRNISHWEFHLALSPLKYICIYLPTKPSIWSNSWNGLFDMVFPPNRNRWRAYMSTLVVPSYSCIVSFEKYHKVVQMH